MWWGRCLTLSVLGAAFRLVAGMLYPAYMLPQGCGEIKSNIHEYVSVGWVAGPSLEGGVVYRPVGSKLTLLLSGKTQ